jgi:hypothetical protein
MKAAVARYWYRHLAHIAALIEALNTDGDPMYSIGNEAISKIAQEMMAHTEDITATQECVAVELDQAS